MPGSELGGLHPPDGPGSWNRSSTPAWLAPAVADGAILGVAPPGAGAAGILAAVAIEVIPEDEWPRRGGSIDITRIQSLR
jgi:hypothetical protein